MSRKLSSNLFSDMPPAAEEVRVPSPTSRTQMESQKLEIGEIRRGLQQLTSQVEILSAQMQQLSHHNEQRLQRQSQAISDMEKGLHRTFAEIDNRLQHTHQKIKDNTMDYSKMESLLERQNLIIQSFESKLAALKRVIEEKEKLLMKYQSLFNHSKNGHRPIL